MDTNQILLVVGIVVAVAAIAAVAYALLRARTHHRPSQSAQTHDALAEDRSRTAKAGSPGSAAPSSPGKSTGTVAASPRSSTVTGSPGEPAAVAGGVSVPERGVGVTVPESTLPPVGSVPEQSQVQVQTPESSGSRLTRLRARLARSANPFGRALFTILSKDHLSPSDWQDVEDTLLLADVGAQASEGLVDRLRENSRIAGTGDAEQVRSALRTELLEEVGTNVDRRLNADKPDAHKPGVIIMVGVNGTGKTTTAGKLARLFVAGGKKVVLAAADTFRAAAADQLQTWGSRVGVPVVRADRDGADPASVAFEAARQARDGNADVLIVDTAGRLQNKSNLMDELGKIRRVTEKMLPVDEVLLVLDATTGQNGMTQAKVFTEAIGVTGVVLTKLDGSAKGGIVISVQRELHVPVKLVGLGEGPDDLSPFDEEAFVDGVLG